MLVSILVYLCCGAVAGVLAGLLGVGGGIVGVLPGVMGIAAFSPKLDGSGNSVRAQHAIKYITNKLGLNLFG